MKILFGLGLGIIVCTIALCITFKHPYVPQQIVTAYNSSTMQTIVSNNATPSSIQISPQQRLKQLVASHGYTWEKWLSNDLPRDIKWEITRENSAYILRDIKNGE